jgi:hypothetical protein
MGYGDISSVKRTYITLGTKKGIDKYGLFIYKTAATDENGTPAFPTGQNIFPDGNAYHVGVGYVEGKLKGFKIYEKELQGRPLQKISIILDDKPNEELIIDFVASSKAGEKMMGLIPNIQAHTFPKIRLEAWCSIYNDKQNLFIKIFVNGQQIQPFYECKILADAEKKPILDKDKNFQFETTNGLPKPKYVYFQKKWTVDNSEMTDFLLEKVKEIDLSLKAQQNTPEPIKTESFVESPQQVDLSLDDTEDLPF